MPERRRKLVFFLSMKATIRKKKIIPTKKISGGVFNELDMAAIQYRIETHPSPEMERVEAILWWVSQLGGDDIARRQALGRLRTLLSRYQYVQQVVPGLPGKGFRVSLRPVPDANRPRAEEWEWGAVGRLISAIPEFGAHPRIRRCAACPKWIFAGTRRNQKFCDNGGKCKQLNNDRDPVKADAKKAYMRKRYAEQKERDRIADERAGIHSKPKKSPAKQGSPGSRRLNVPASRTR